MEEIDFEKRFRKACDSIIELSSKMNVSNDYKEAAFKDISRICTAQIKNCVLKNASDKRLAR